MLSIIYPSFFKNLFTPLNDTRPLISNTTLTILSTDPIDINIAKAIIGELAAIAFAVNTNIKYINACNGCIKTFTVNSFIQDENACALPSPALSIE